MGLLEQVGSFRKLRGLNTAQLDGLCSELREKILNVTLKNGGHLGASLGAVELTVALLRAYNPDKDKIIFDVGHQAYSYKILTDRMDRFDTLRTKGGIAGFPRISESKYDFFTTGHSSTSLSAAIGYAKARDLKKEKHNVVAVIGDGALLNGVAFEALNCVAHADTKIIIVLNDNEMSIGKRVGGMSAHLSRIGVNPAYKKLKDFIKEQCRSAKNGNSIESTLSRAKSRLKSLLLPTNIFEEVGVSYWGPFDGHNVQEMEEVFELAKGYDKPLLIHVVTKKGKGCPEAEENPCLYHGIGPNTKLEQQEPKKASLPSWSEVMSDTLLNLADEDPRIAVCTAAMADGTKLNKFAAKYPKRFFDVGIAEEHMLVYAAGLAAGGMLPAVCIYSTFLQRAVDQVMHDICLSKLPVLIGVDRAGFVGEDGETHHGLFDIAWLRALPDITLAAPRDAADLQYFVSEWQSRMIPMAVRYPRGGAKDALMPEDVKKRKPAPWGKLEVMREGKDICLIGVGSTVGLMQDAAKKVAEEGKADPTVLDLRFIKPLDYDSLREIIKSHKKIIVAEEACLAGGIGEAIAVFAAAENPKCKVTALGAPDEYVPHATRAEQWADCGLTVQNIADLCKKK